MRFIIIALCLATAVLAQDKYTDLSDDFDVSEILKNERLLNSYGKCLLGKGPCTPDIKQVRERLPEALATRCAKCTERQKELARQLAQGVKKKRPELWKDLVAKYDPNGKYAEAFKDFLTTQR